MEIILTIVFVAIWVAICVKMAGTRNRNKVTWGVLGAVFGVFSVIALALLGQSKEAVA